MKCLTPAPPLPLLRCSLPARVVVCAHGCCSFIVARLGGSLFIIDQHAADEKFNFERLQRDTVLNRQPLIRLN